ncbi:MAG: hypothetical protein ACTHNL_05550 [Devosia sp.]|jgi:hypothetical protein
MTEGKLSRRDSLKGLALLGAGAVTATAVTGLTAEAEAAQVHMDIALGTLNTALHQLQDAIPDKGGHRVKAIALVREAIAQVELGIKAGR